MTCSRYQARMRGAAVAITRIRGTRRLDQQDVHFFASDGAMLNTLGHHKQLARLECDRLARRQCIPRMLNLRSAAPGGPDGVSLRTPQSRG
jgi:hypothetical protein